MNHISGKDVEHIVTIVGREGAISALSNSRKIGVDDLVGLAHALRLKAGSRDGKGKIATLIVRHVDRRIDKTLDELKAMAKDEIVGYFEHVRCEQDEIVELLESIDLRARASSRRALLEFAAAQISNLGIFERLAERPR